MSFFGQDSQPVDAEVTILSGRALEVPTDSTEACRFDAYINEALATPHIPDPIRIRGIGSTTL